MPTEPLRVVDATATNPTLRDQIVEGIRKAAAVVIVGVALAVVGHTAWTTVVHRDDPRPEWVASAKSLATEARAIPVTEANKVFVQSIPAQHYAEIDCRSIVTTSPGTVEEVSDAWFRRLLDRGWTLRLQPSEAAAASPAVRAIDPNASWRDSILIDSRSYAARPEAIRAAAAVAGGGQWELRDELEATLAVVGPGPYSFSGCESGHPVRSHTTEPGSSLIEFNMRGTYAR